MEITSLIVLIEKGMSAKEMAVELKCSRTNIRYWLKKFGLKTNLLNRPETRTRGPGRPKKSSGVGRNYVCRCGDTNPQNFSKSKPNKCRKCYCRYVVSKRKLKRAYAINYLGGKCLGCGYNKHHCSLAIHHLNPSIKDNKFSHMASWSKEKILKEIQSCILLCHNCHMAHHSGYDIFQGIAQSGRVLDLESRS